MLHAISTALVKRAASIAVNGFAVKERIEAEKNRTAGRLVDAAFGEFCRQLQYKSKWHGRGYEYSAGDQP